MKNKILTNEYGKKITTECNHDFYEWCEKCGGRMYTIEKCDDCGKTKKCMDRASSDDMYWVVCDNCYFKKEKNE